MEENSKNIKMIPVIAMRGLVCFPKLVMHFDVAREISVKAVEEALKGDRMVFLTAQKDIFVDEPAKTDLFKIGVIAEIKQTLKTPDNILRVLVEGISRARITDLENSDGMLKCSVKKLPDYSRAEHDEIELAAASRSVK